MNSKLMFSSVTDEWATPQDFFDLISPVFNFDLDVCALDSSAKCDRYFTPETDGLNQDWTGVCWMNPPYGRDIGKWMEKARIESVINSSLVACLVPARTDTKWWHDNVPSAEAVLFLKGRLKFGGSKNAAPFPSALVIFSSVPVYHQVNWLDDAGLQFWASIN